jgi:phosphoglycolate phosphatase
MKHLVMFDLDGTLLDSQRGILSALATTIENFGVTPPPHDELVTHIGASLWKIFADLLQTSDQATLDAAAAEYRRVYGLGPIFDYEVYDGVVTMLQHVRDMDLRVVIATAKAWPYAQRVVASTPFASMIDVVYGSEEDGTRTDKKDLLRYVVDREQIHTDHVIMVGDRSHDINGAVHNGIDGIGVLYGYGSPAELQNATALASTPMDVVDIVRRLHSQ